MNFITSAQCRAARALLNWSQPDLAQRCDIHVQTISGFESDKGSPTKSTLILIRKALEDAGIELTDANGVRERRQHVRIYEGKNIHRQLLDEIYDDLKESGGEILIKGLDENRWAEGDDAAFLKFHIERLLAAKITERLLISENYDLLIVDKGWYRKIPKKYFTNQTVWIFKNKIGIVSWGDIEKLIIIENEELFISEVRQFNCIWDNVAKPLN